MGKQNSSFQLHTVDIIFHRTLLRFLSIKSNTGQGLFQDFSEGVLNPKGDRQPIILPNFPENWTRMKKIGLGAFPKFAYVDPSPLVFRNIMSRVFCPCYGKFMRFNPVHFPCSGQNPVNFP